ncbi:putative glutaredoxin, Thioredoxin-like superfamily [Helianthus debilis subsp. tardiflorus]
MGCATSHLLNHDEDFPKIGSSALSHHIVSLTSTTYGLLTLDPSSSKAKTTISIFPKPGSEAISESPPEVINSWELMAGLDSTTESFRLYRQPSKIFQENSNLDPQDRVIQEISDLDHKDPIFLMAGVDSTNENRQYSIIFQEDSNLDPNQVFHENSDPDHKNPILHDNSNDDHRDPIFLMAGLDSKTKSFRLYRQPSKIFHEGANLVPKNSVFQDISNHDHKNPIFQENANVDHKIPIFLKPITPKRFSLDEFENLCPPKGENKVVVYTTTLRGVRRTFEACNTVRTVLEGYGVFVCERDISMDSGFREELRDLMIGKDSKELVPPRVFVNSRYVGGVDEVVRSMEDGSLDQLLEGLPKSKSGYVCDGCGGVRFLPCFRCNGSCKMVDWKVEFGGQRKRVVARCGDCNENGLVHCPICG